MRCDVCEAPIPVAEKQGRPRRYCSRACQQKAYRARQSSPIPAVMREQPRWIRWEPRMRNGRISKVPRTVSGRDADVTDPKSWSTFERASAGAAGGRIGFVLGGGIGCIDLDHCIDEGGVAAWARGIIAQHRDDAIFIEESPSGTGVHIFLPLAEAPGRRIRDGEVNIEIYSRDRYMTVTGKAL